MGMIGYRPEERCRWLGRNVWAWAGRLGECVNDDIKLLGLQPECAMFRDMWRAFISGQL